MIEALGVELWDGRRPAARRHKVADFPMLRAQKRSAFGFHQVGDDGAERCPPPLNRASVVEGLARPALVVATAEEAAADAKVRRDWRPARLLEILQELADAGAGLPPVTELGRRMGMLGEYNHYHTLVHNFLKSLELRGDVRNWVGARSNGGSTRPRAIRLRDGRVLRNAFAPAVIDWGDGT